MMMIMLMYYALCIMYYDDNDGDNVLCIKYYDAGNAGDEVLCIMQYDVDADYTTVMMYAVL